MGVRDLPRVKHPPIGLPNGFEIREDDECVVVRDAAADVHCVLYKHPERPITRGLLRAAVEILQIRKGQFT